MKRYKITILGGSGFVGRHLVNRLAPEGHQILIPSQHPERNRSLLVHPTVKLVQANIHSPDELKNILAGSEVVINLVGILNEAGRNHTSFQQAHVLLPHKVVDACRHNHVKRLLHMSALGADAAYGASHYLRSKGEGENIVHSAHEISVTTLKPSVIFGPGDSFFNRFSALLKKIPGPFPLACPEARFAPIYVGDVVECFALALDNPATYGQRYELCGPNSYTLKQLISYTAATIGSHKPIIGLGDSLSRLQASLMEWLPGKPFTRDNYHSMQRASVCEHGFPAVFEFTPRSVESIVPNYLNQAGERRRYDRLRTQARRT